MGKHLPSIGKLPLLQREWKTGGTRQLHRDFVFIGFKPDVFWHSGWQI
jgi:hypothetical protein